MSFLDDEASVEQNRPREFYEIVQSASVTYRIASGQRDIIYSGKTYVASPAARTETYAQTPSGDQELTLALPLSHPLCQRYMALGTPPMRITVTVYRMQVVSGAVEQIWSGFVASFSFDRHLGLLKIPSRFSRTLRRSLPTMTVSKLCPHILYDKQCLVDRSAFQVATTVVTHNGRTLVLASLVSPPPIADIGNDTFLKYGEVKHVSTGETRTIFAQTNTVMNLGSPTFQIEMQAPMPDIAVGDSVIVAAGCDRSTSQCYAKFANMANFGGYPELPNVNLFFPGNGRGIYST